jgi:cobalt-zinc-cadmium efflux system protein
MKGHDDNGAHGEHHHDHRGMARRRLLFCIVITAVMMVVEVVGGLISNSLALVSDAGHMMTHFMALLISYFAIRLASRPATDQRSYGYFRAEILAAFVNGVFLVFVTIYLIYEAVKRIINPERIEITDMLVVAAAGLVVNLITAALLSGAGTRDINIRSAFLHMIGDTLSSVAIVGGAILILFTDWYIVDPLLSGIICALIVYWAYKLLRESAYILLEFAPAGIKAADVKDCLTSVEGIRDAHDLHVWQITSNMYALTAHVVVDDVKVSETCEILARAAKALEDRFCIEHFVIQCETESCRAFGYPHNNSGEKQSS